jgi:hypothetical protein
MVRGLLGSLEIKPKTSSLFSWCDTLAVEDRPTASPISRMEGA